LSTSLSRPAAYRESSRSIWRYVSISDTFLCFPFWSPKRLTLSIYPCCPEVVNRLKLISSCRSVLYPTHISSSNRRTLQPGTFDSRSDTRDIHSLQRCPTTPICRDRLCWCRYVYALIFIQAGLQAASFLLRAIPTLRVLMLERTSFSGGRIHGVQLTEGLELGVWRW
jgi:hypothetical protein